MHALSRTCRALKLALGSDAAVSSHLRHICSTLAQQASAHPLQSLTDTYLPPPAEDQNIPDSSDADISGQFWSPSDPATSPAASEQPTRLRPVDPLAQWIFDHGGYVHSHLKLGNSPTLGCRGVVATNDIEGLLDNESLIMLPNELVLTVKAAKVILSERLSERSLGELEGKSLNMMLALALCSERKKGPSSFWKPYIASLPSKPPCPWLLKEKQQKIALQSAGPSGQFWRSGLKAVARERATEIAGTVRTYGSLLGLGIADVQWGLGMVMSRTFSSDVDTPSGSMHSEPCLLPFIDMCNHHDKGLSPGWGRNIDNQWVACVVNPAGGLLLKKGDELFTTYFGVAKRGLNFFLNYGFVR